MDTKRDLTHQSQTEDNFVTFSLGLAFLSEAEKEKNNGKGDSASAPSRFASLSEGEVQQILTERHSDKTKQMTNWSGKYKNSSFNRKFEIKQFLFFLIFRLPRTFTSDIVVRFSRRI